VPSPQLLRLLAGLSKREPRCDTYVACDALTRKEAQHERSVGTDRTGFRELRGAQRKTGAANRASPIYGSSRGYACAHSRCPGVIAGASPFTRCLLSERVAPHLIDTTCWRAPYACTHAARSHRVEVQPNADGLRQFDPVARRRTRIRSCRWRPTEPPHRRGAAYAENRT
jgi:hypothetical protein